MPPGLDLIAGAGSDRGAQGFIYTGDSSGKGFPLFPLCYTLSKNAKGMPFLAPLDVSQVLGSAGGFFMGGNISRSRPFYGVTFLPFFMWSFLYHSGAVPACK